MGHNPTLPWTVWYTTRLFRGNVQHIAFENRAMVDSFVTHMSRRPGFQLLDIELDPQEAYYLEEAMCEEII